MGGREKGSEKKRKGGKARAEKRKKGGQQDSNRQATNEAAAKVVGQAAEGSQ